MGRNNRKKKSPIGSGKFTNVEDLKNRFFANSEERRKAGDKAHGDAGYWNGGRCEWGGSHNLQEDCNALAEFFNATASISDDVEKIKLSANETIFNQNKQASISKIQDCISKCQTSNTYSIASVCCIWSDYFGSFLKPFLNTFSSKLQRQLGDVQKLEPKHQKELLQLEQEARELQSAYDENLKKANDPNTSPEDKREFLLLASQTAEKAKRLKSKIKQNPLADLSRFSNLDDLEILIGGSVPKNPSSKGSGRNSRSSNSSQKNRGGGSDPDNSQSQNNQQQFLIFAGLTILAIFFLMNQSKDHD